MLFIFNSSLLLEQTVHLPILVAGLKQGIFLECLDDSSKDKIFTFVEAYSVDFTTIHSFVFIILTPM